MLNDFIKIKNIFDNNTSNNYLYVGSSLSDTFIPTKFLSALSNTANNRSHLNQIDFYLCILKL